MEKFESEPSKTPTVEIMVGGLKSEYLPGNPKEYAEKIIFIPGSGLTSKSGVPVIESFAQGGFDSISLNLKGRLGELPASVMASRTLADFSQDLGDARDTLKEEGLDYNQQVLVGHSLGATIAMEQARKKPPKALILLAPSLPKGFPMPELTKEEEGKRRDLAAKGEVIESDRSDLLRYFGERLPKDFDESFEEKYKPLLGQESYLAKLELYTNQLEISPSDIKCPILIVGGVEDPRVKPETLRQLAKFLGADYLETEASHMIMIDSSWEDFSKQIVGWLKEHCKDENE